MGESAQKKDSAVARKTSKIDYRVFQHAHIQGISEVIDANQPYKRLIWLIAVIMTNIACGIHLYFLLKSFIEYPYETKVTFESRDALLAPTVIICQPTTRFLNPDSVANISAEYYYALELGVGLIHISERDRLQDRLNISKIEEYYEQIFNENRGDVAAAYRYFHEKHMRKCEETFAQCYTELFTRVDCCKIFEPVFTLYGMCYAAKNGSVLITGSESLANFRFLLNFSQSARPHFFSQQSTLPSRLAVNAEAYSIGFSSGLDQGNYLIQRQLVLRGQWLEMNMIQRQSILIEKGGDDSCVPNTEQFKTLYYFMEYTRSNCRWERSLLNNLTLLNAKCELPLVQLLNSSHTSQSPCNLKQIFSLFGYKENDPIIYYEKDIKDMQMDLDSEDFVPYISEYCDVFGNRTDLPKCTAEKLLSIGLTEEANRYLYFFNNTLPYSLEQKLGENIKSWPNPIPTCAPLCNTTDYWLAASSVNSREGLEKDTASVTLQYTTKEVEMVTEEKKQTVAEYLAMIGGNIGMCNGASLLALGHLAALGVGALGFQPFRAPEVQ